MQCLPTRLPEVCLIEPRIHTDPRGYFLETWNAQRYTALGLPERMSQDNLSFSHRGVLRGLHYQYPRPQGKLVYALTGAIFDVAVDIRSGSPTFGQWVAAELSGENRRQIYIPEGFAHGFCVLSESALVAYKCTDVYVPEHDAAIRFDDPRLAIDWPIADPVLSPKDAAAPWLADVPAERLPVYAPGAPAPHYSQSRHRAADSALAR